jgi:uncharacterized protein
MPIAQDPVAYKASGYNFFVPLANGDTLVYNSVGNSLAVWNKFEREIYGVVSDCAGVDAAMSVAGNERYLASVLENLRKGAFIVERGLDERKKIDEAVKLIRFDDTTLTLTIAPTLACNFQCDYCYQGDHTKNQVMSKEVSNKLLDFVKKKLEGKRTLAVSWYGGEPLLAKAQEILFGLSGKFISFCDEKKKEKIFYNAMIVTNGYFLTRDVARRLADLKVFTAQVTLDGDREVHDRRRVLRGGGPTFDRILENLVHVVEDGQLDIHIRVNIDKRNCESIEGLMDKLCDAGLAGRKNLSMYFAPVDICSRECLKIAAEVMPLEEYASIEARLLKVAAGRKLAVPSMPFRMFSLCAAVKPNGFVILPNGDVHKCWNTVPSPEDKVCGIDDIDSADSTPIQAQWLERGLFSLPECQTCPMLVNCAGGCAHIAKSGLANPCRSLKYNISDMLVLLGLSRGAIKADDVPEG